MTDAERNPLKGRTGSFCLPIPIIHGTAREGIAAVPHNLPILQRSTANIETDINTTVISNTDIVNTRNGMDLLSEPLVDHRVTANISDLTMTSAAYKKVANKVRPVPTTLPEEFRIVRRAHPNPLENMPV